MRTSVYLILVPLAVLWAVEVANLFMDHRLVEWGILPRTRSGLIGIPLSPFLHGGPGHALSNSIPLVVLGAAVLLGGHRQFIGLSLFAILAGGGLVWLLGRSSYHVGASTVVFGYFGCLLGRVWYERTFGAVAVAVAVLLLYGGFLWGLVPTSTEISWEGHLAGFLVGVLGARIMRSGSKAEKGR